MALKQRKEMDAAYQWDLSHIFPTVEAWEEAYTAAEQAIETIAPVKGTLGESAAALKAGLDTLYAAAQKVELVYLYASLDKHGDNGDAAAQAREGRAMNLYVRFSMAASFVDPEILAIEETLLEEYLKDDILKGYRHIVADTARARAHTLDGEKEEMLAMLSDAAGGCSNCFDMLESVDMTFPAIRDENGEEVELTHGNFAFFRESTDGRVRRESFEKYLGEFRRYINTFAAMYSGSVKMDTFHTRARKYPSACERALFHSNVPLSVYDSLVEAVHRSIPAMESYLALRKKALGLDELHMYDLYCPMVDEVDYKLTLEEAEDLVRKALAPLGADYQALLDKAFDEKWMDVYENKGKTTGAFSCGVYGVHPYVLLNFTGTLEDAYTIAHELGHAMHSYLSAAAQEYPVSEYKILVAEVASTVNEVLLTRYLLQAEKDPKRRAYVLNHFLEGFRTTVFRQTLFAEFERCTHEMDYRGEPLTAESMNALYRRLNEQYYPGVVIDELQDVEWARIPHFYNAFYVYQYATGFSAAVAIADGILKTGSAENYLRFLSTGGSDYPLEELKIAGVDLTEPETVERALAVFAKTIDELKELL
ncbi:MAG: oligoendopeptidase F [Oscillospiraceae bacterium]|nr:oligoendopeptidase F [Oscillospiraceae bacterium]